MTFRQRLFLFLAVMIFTLCALEALTDYWEQRQTLKSQASQALDLLDNYADVVLRLEGDTFVASQDETIPFDSRIRVLESGQVLLTIDQSKPGAMFMTREKALTATQTLELAYDLRASRAILMQSFWRDLAFDLVVIVVGLILAWWLSAWSLVPLNKLSAVIQELASQTIPTGITAEPRNDVLGQLIAGFNRLSRRNQFALDRERVLMNYAAQELTVPLHAMAERIESLVMGVESVGEAIPVMQRNLERIQQVLLTLPNLAQISHVQHYPVSLVQVLKETLQLIPEADQSRIALQISLPANPKVTHPILVTQSVLSLLDNALQSQGEVKVTLEPYEAMARLRIEHDGLELPEPILKHLQQPLALLPDDADDDVLRLAFTRHIVVNLSGRLDIRNTSRGLEVIMDLPMVLSDSLPLAVSEDTTFSAELSQSKIGV